MSRTCRRCGETLPLLGTHDHHCPPEWDVAIDDYHGGIDQGWTIRAWSDDAAVRKAAERYDRDDPCLSENNTITVQVRRQGDEVITRFSVYCRLVPQYYATRQN